MVVRGREVVRYGEPPRTAGAAMHEAPELWGGGRNIVESKYKV